MSRQKHLIILSIALIIISALSCNDKKKSKKPEIKADNKQIISDSLYGINIDSLDLNEYIIQNGDNLSSIFSNLGIANNRSSEIVNKLGGYLNEKKIQAGKPYLTLSTNTDSITNLEYIIFEQDKTNFVIINLSSDSVKVENYTKEIKYKELYTEGVITSSLWNAMKENNTNPVLALELSDIYGWQIDFFGIQVGDSYEVIYDVAFVDDSIPLYIDQIKTAKFRHQNENYYAFQFEQDSVQEYFDLEGKSLKKAFLKAPLNYSRISSHFSNARFHPVLKIYRAHHGVDYVAPTGTPVRTIGDGVVTAKAFQKGGAGYYLKIKHNSNYLTSYMHLSKFQKGIAVGSKVKQGDIIGYVGSTGLSTGAHLDFRVFKNGTPINPLKMESPPSIPIKEENLFQFNLEILKDLALLSSKGPNNDNRQDTITINN